MGDVACKDDWSAYSHTNESFLTECYKTGHLFN